VEICKSLFYLKSAKNLLSTESLKTIYYALIHPHFLYCLPVVSSTSQKNLRSLIMMQKLAVRIISRSKYNAHTQALFYSLGILPINDLITQQICHFMHALEYRYLPDSFFNFVVKNSDIANHDYPIRNGSGYYIPRIRSNFLKSFPFYSFPSNWNRLPEFLCNISSKQLFKMNLKTSLLQRNANFICQKLFCYSCSNL